MSEAATPAPAAAPAEAPATAPETPAATATETPAPAAASAATPATPEGSVTLTQKEHDDLQRNAARAAGNQRKASLYDRLHPENGGHFSPAQTPAPATPAPTEEEAAARARQEDSKAERGILGLAADPEYREVFDADPTLRDMFTKNPLSVLPMFANDALDAQDAIDLVKEKLGERKTALTAKTADAPADPSATAPATPPAGGAPAVASEPNAEYEAAKALPNAENAVAGMFGAKLKAAIKK